jgi:Protein of unknown function (DUF3800)
MRIFFVDESGTADRGDTKFLVLAGLILKCEEWPSLKSTFDEQKAEFGINPNIEVKWRHVRHPGGHDNPLRTLTDAERIRFGMQALSIVRAAKTARVIGVIIDKGAAYARPEIRTESDLYERAVTLAMERYQYHLRASHDFGMIVQDQRRPHQDLRLRAFYAALLTAGTRWTKFPNIIEGVFLTPSHYSIGIQLVDFVAGAFYAAHCTGKREQKFFNVIRGQDHRRPKERQAARLQKVAVKRKSVEQNRPYGQVCRPPQRALNANTTIG